MIAIASVIQSIPYEYQTHINCTAMRGPKHILNETVFLKRKNIHNYYYI